jgi:two-component system, NarL family, sensor histidine kinase DesK
LVVLVAGGNLTLALTPVLSRRALYAVIGFGAAATIGWDAIIVSDDWSSLLTEGVVYAMLVGLAVVFYRVSEWMLVLVWELDAARTVQARLSVAEERLRFARDFHDVLGRNLTLIAVTSDLAAGLARRGDPDAVDKMLQVHSIAHESARGVREVVTGYRAADLDTELTGARSVLRAAGITTRIIGDSTCIPGDAQVAFAWVLREATTNVIRHSNATTCTIELGIDPATEAGAADTAVLRIHNDGAPPLDPSHPPGHGLAGLRERVKNSGGHLAAGPEPGGRFTVEARLPATNTTTPATNSAAPAVALDPAP